MSATGYVDACGFLPVSTGTVDFVVSAAIQGYQTPASAGAINGSIYSYRAESADKSQWEIGFGAYTVGSVTLARTTVNASSTGSKVSFSAAPNVFITAFQADLQNATMIGLGTLNVARINGGTANQFVQGDGTFQTQGRKLLNTLTASASASLDDTTSITAAFTEYEIILENIIGATASQTLQFQVQSAATFQTATYLGAMIVGNGSTVSAQNSTTGIPLCNTNGTPTTGPGISARHIFSNPAGTTVNKIFHGTWGANTNVGGTTNGYWNGGTGAITGIRLISTSGNLTSGVMKIYGLS